MILGAQLYTLRSRLTTVEGFDEVLRELSKIGYTAIQVSGVECNFTPEWLAEKCKQYGMKVALTHEDYEDIVEKTDELIAKHKLWNCEYIGLGCFPNFRELTEERLCEYLAALKPAAEKMAANGIKFMYHNHDLEFGRPSKGGKIFLDTMLDTLPAELFGTTLDMYWVQAGGGDCAAWLRKCADRAHCVHLKDMVYDIADRKAHYAPIGEGNMNYAEIVKVCEEIGVKYGFVELDSCYGDDPMDCLRRSYDYLSANFGLK